MGPIFLNSGSGYARLAWSAPILVGQAKNLVFNRPTPLYVYDNLSIKKTWVSLCAFQQTQGLELNPWLHRLYFTNYSIAADSKENLAIQPVNFIKLGVRTLFTICTTFALCERQSLYTTRREQIKRDVNRWPSFLCGKPPAGTGCVLVHNNMLPRICSKAPSEGFSCHGHIQYNSMPLHNTWQCFLINLGNC